ncbi:MAG: SDR family NAD(P)-dependent oxidoreductase [Gluconacetobacter diazotrophicus]|nr:SDR family NAD(P)-dependent oxidoreductase [Gluconacetobacter diazotrophicus]
MGMKTWFITGASRGFGRIWTQAALARGDQVAGVVRDPASVTELRDHHPDTFLPLPGDVTDAASIGAAVARAHATFGRLDVVVCNAGYAQAGAIEEVGLDDVRDVFDTNVVGVVATIQAALPLLREQSGGHILTVSSIGGLVSFPTAGLYTATKHAVEALSQSLAGEVRPFGIRVTIIEPGSFDTTFRQSARHAAAMPIYDPVREAVMRGFDPSHSGDPLATPEALFAVVDSDEPPLRLILGSRTLPVIRKFYADRMVEWETWRAVSDKAQG